MSAAEKTKCNFCGEECDSSKLILEGFNGFHICEDCVSSCVEVMREEFELDEKAESENAIPKRIEKPSKIKEYLDQYVIGQEYAKETLAVAVYNHYKMIEYKKMNNDVEIEKSNVMIIGPTGTGKTHILKTLAKFIDVPFAISDATSITESGYVGDDVENILLKLIQAADGDIEKAQKGIIYIDEIDKLSRKGENVSITRDVGGEGVQQAILKMVEGAIIDVPPSGGRKFPGQTCLKIDTTNILFVVGGSFEGIEKIIAKRKSKKSTIGFSGEISKINNPSTDLIQEVTVEDLKKFGMIPELLGRFPVIAPLKELDIEALESILTKPKNAIIKQYQELFKMDNIKLNFDEASLAAVAKKAKQTGTGARALRGIIESSLHKYMFNLPDDPSICEVLITESVIDGNAEPVIIKAC